jgi:hypothetical protein
MTGARWRKAVRACGRYVLDGLVMAGTWTAVTFFPSSLVEVGRPPWTADEREQVLEVAGRR